MQRPINILNTSVDGEPVDYEDNGVKHKVLIVVDHWMEGGAWWLGEPGRTIYRVVTDHNGIYDLECLHKLAQRLRL